MWTFYWKYKRWTHQFKHVDRKNVGEKSHTIRYQHMRFLRFIYSILDSVYSQTGIIRLWHPFIFLVFADQSNLVDYSPRTLQMLRFDKKQPTTLNDNSKYISFSVLSALSAEVFFSCLFWEQSVINWQLLTNSFKVDETNKITIVRQ